MRSIPTFSIGSRCTNYKLSVGGYTGDAGIQPRSRIVCSVAAIVMLHRVFALSMKALACIWVQSTKFRRPG